MPPCRMCYEFNEIMNSLNSTLEVSHKHSRTRFKSNMKDEEEVEMINMGSVGRKTGDQRKYRFVQVIWRNKDLAVQWASTWCTVNDQQML